MITNYDIILGTGHSPELLNNQRNDDSLIKPSKSPHHKDNLLNLQKKQVRNSFSFFFLQY